MTLAEWAKILQVWAKGLVIPGFDSNAYRKDEYGFWMQKDKYGNREADFGWEIDHIVPVSQNGGDDISNLRPLNWQANAKRQDGNF